MVSVTFAWTGLPLTKHSSSLWLQGVKSLNTAKVHASANRVGSLSAEDKSYLGSKQATCKVEARLECETLTGINQKGG